MKDYAQTEREALKMIHAAGIEVMDDPRSYREIAYALGLGMLTETVELVLPVEETKV